MPTAETGLQHGKLVMEPAKRSLQSIATPIGVARTVNEEAIRT